jgi:4-methylaminobutanoate oxidase (formaldehyde-forming)
MIAAGYRAIDSMRVEKSYRVWASDLTAETTPDEAGLAFCVRIDKPGGFEGREALLAARESGLTQRMRAVVLADPARVVLGGEPVRIGREVVGRVTSGGFGYSVSESIAFAYLPTALGPGTVVDVEMFGVRVPGAVHEEPRFDPEQDRVRRA